MKTFLTLFLLSILAASCSSPVSKIFGVSTPHEKYADKVENTVPGKQWLAASEQALNNPHPVQLPHKQQGYFQADKPRALAIQFAARQGEKLGFKLNRNMAAGTVIYADIYEEDGTRVSHILAPAISDSVFSFDAEKTANYILRLQPELFKPAEYTLAITAEASLEFPVAGNKARAGSFWGDDRDGGKRRHEGIDIFAPRLTPAVAAADGYISRVANEGIGGKTVWLKPSGKNISLYYAHLDQQLVHEGQFVKKGQAIGLVGNTGNAKHTPAHLHFGIYTFSGAVDPFPFVNKKVKKAGGIPDKNLKGFVQLIKNHKSNGVELAKANTIMVPLAITPAGYIAELPGGSIIEAPYISVKWISAEKQQQQALAGEAKLKSAGG